jgi:hypothetical protein
LCKIISNWIQKTISKVTFFISLLFSAYKLISFLLYCDTDLEEGHPQVILLGGFHLAPEHRCLLNQDHVSISNAVGGLLEGGRRKEEGDRQVCLGLSLLIGMSGHWRKEEGDRQVCIGLSLLIGMSGHCSRTIH